MHLSFPREMLRILCWKTMSLVCITSALFCLCCLYHYSEVFYFILDDLGEDADDESFMWLLSNDMPWPEVTVKWEETSQRRQKHLNSCSKIFEYVQKFPCLTSPSGWKLVRFFKFFYLVFYNILTWLFILLDTQSN